MMKSIDTAPKDGTHILGYGLHLDDCDEGGVGFCEVYWYSELNKWYNITNYPSKVISWMPLPETNKHCLTVKREIETP